MVDETITVGCIEESVEDSEEEISDEENDENEIDNELDIDDGTSCRSVAAVDVEDLGMTVFWNVSSGRGRNFLCAIACVRSRQAFLMEKSCLKIHWNVRTGRISDFSILIYPSEGLTIRIRSKK